MSKGLRWVILALLGLPSLGRAQFSYVTNTGAITITGFTGAGDVAIPATINGRPVTRIAHGAFQDNTNLSIVRIPDSVTNLGAYAFSGCTWLIGVVMPAYLPNIGAGTFSNCFQLTGLTIPQGVTNIGRGAFFSCSSLLNLQIPDTVATIKDSAFETDWRLTQVSLGHGVASIGNSAFAGCTSLAELFLGTNLQNIGHDAFNSCSNLSTITLPKRIASIGSQAFAFCTGLQTVYFTGNAPPDSGDAFLGDPVAFVDYLPQTSGWATSFGGARAVLWNPQASFRAAGSNGLTFYITGDKSLSVVIEASTNLASGSWVPVATKTLADGPAAFTDPAWASSSSRFYRLRPAAPLPYFYSFTNGEVMITRYRGPGGAVTIPDTINGLPVTTIGSRAFGDGYWVTSLVLGSNVVTLAPDALLGANGLSNLVLDNAVTTIGSQAIYGDFRNKTLAIPASVRNVDPGAFVNCYGLAGFAVDEANPAYCSVDGVLFNKSQTSLVACPASKPGFYIITNGITNVVAYAFASCTALAAVLFPDTVQTIGDYAFSRCEGLLSLDLPSSLASLGNSAFADCSHLGVVTVRGGTIGDNAFQYCYVLYHLVLGANVTSIGSNAFSGCNLATVTIPAAVTNIGTMPFADDSLTDIEVDPLNPAYRSVNGILFDAARTTLVQYPAAKVANAGNYAIPDTVTNIGDGAFYACGGLTNVTIPEGVQYLGPQAFESCFNLGSVALPNGITNIPYAAFQDCRSLTNVVLGTNVVDIGFNAFLDCGNLAKINVPNSVARIEPGAFCNCPALSAITLGDQVLSVGYDAFFNCFSLSKVTIESGNLSIEDYAFAFCRALRAIYFTGNAPSTGDHPFYQDDATVYYLRGTSGWGPMLGGLPTALWNP